MLSTNGVNQQSPSTMNNAGQCAMMHSILRKLKARGVTLIMVAGVLAILAALGAGFFTLMISQSRSSSRYADSVRAELLAEAGIEDAIGRLREQAYLKTEDPTDAWYTVDWLHGASRRVSFPALLTKNKQVAGASNVLAYTRSLSNSSGIHSDQFVLNVEDAGGKINLNHCDNLGVLLDNLCRVVGPPLKAADIAMLQPARWAAEGANKADYGTNANDTYAKLDIYHVFDDTHVGTDVLSGMATENADKTAIYGDGYAIATYRSRHGLYQSIVEVKSALTVLRNPAHPELEDLEREIKFNAIRDYITVDSWVDSNTVCVGKFEWVNSTGTITTYNGKTIQYLDPNATSSASAKIKSGPLQIFIDRDKSWVADDPKNDPQNQRGSLRGCYLSIMNGHGSGQLRRIATNGIDWVAVEMKAKMFVEPGPISSYMIVSKEDALTEVVATQYGAVTFPKTDAAGHLVDDPGIDYSARPLCIHRAPININTASDKVLTAMFMGINVQHGHPAAIGTDADLASTKLAWFIKDPHYREEFVLLAKGLKRVPVSTGRLVLNRPRAWDAADNINFDYICNFGALALANFATTTGGTAVMNEAHELAYRIVVARQRTVDPKTGQPKAAGTSDPDPTTYDKTLGFAGFERGPFRSWDDLYFRVVKPWDDIRNFPEGEAVPFSGKAGKVGLGKSSVARVIMAHFNSNTDILKFNPNIEWIDRWGRNFTEMEPVMMFTDQPATQVTAGAFSCMGHGIDPKTGKGVEPANPVGDNSVPIFALEVGGGGKVLGVPNAPNNNQGAYISRNYRYKSDEMIDKTDLNRSTTEFSFDSNGIYSITSIGQVVKTGGEVASERRIDALVKVYDVWRESTQRQFVNGTFSQAANQSLAFHDDSGNYSGSIARDGNPSNDGTKRMALTTQPEPLVPIHYKATKKYGRPNTELMDTTFRDAYGNPRVNPYGGGGSAADVPDILANRVPPAGYDGQIVLISNTQSFDPKGADKDTFLASYDGDLDSTTCVGNGREQAKTPNNSKIRVVDTIGLLGLLNDTEVDTDVSLTGKPYLPGTAPDQNGIKVYPFKNVQSAMVGLDPRPIAGGRTPYWENMLCRMGDLRTDGVYLSGPGVAGNDGTLKYLVGEATTGASAHENFQLNDNEGTTISMWTKTTWHYNDNRTHEFFNCVNPGAGSRAEACYICKDGRVKWCNLGSHTTFGISDAGARNNDLGFIFEGRNTQGVGDWSDPDYPVYLHGGYTGVPESRLHQYDNGKPSQPEASAYRLQPFRWHYLGGKINYGPLNQIYKSGAHTPFASWTTDQKKYMIPRPPYGGTPAAPGAQLKEGYLTGNLDTNADAQSIDMAYQAAYWIRPFIDSERYPEGPGFAPAVGSMVKGSIPQTLTYKYWGCWQIQGALPWGMPCAAGDWKDYEYGKTPSQLTPDCHNEGGMGQPIAWPWANNFKPGSPRVFSLNNINLGDPVNYTNPNFSNANSTFYNIYRHLIEDGTYAVIDEFKISNRADMLCTASDRVVREQSTSRYYLPQASSGDTNPTFTSQSLYASLKGTGQTLAAGSPQNTVIVARVSWSVFTPRFMHEYKKPELSKFVRKKQWLTEVGSSPNNPKAFTIPFKGPFDYDIYNDDSMISGAAAEAVNSIGLKNRYFSVARPYPEEFKDKQSHSTKGVQVELLDDTAVIKGAREQHRGQADFVATGTFTNPDVENRLGTLAAPAVVKTDKLHYRVRFVYPIDNEHIDPAGGTTVDPTKHYLLDTPVFDDISITYFTKPLIYSYHQVSE